jgi:hypothetical protein
LLLLRSNWQKRNSLKKKKKRRRRKPNSGQGEER